MTVGDARSIEPAAEAILAGVALGRRVQLDEEESVGVRAPAMDEPERKVRERESGPERWFGFIVDSGLCAWEEVGITHGAKRESAVSHSFSCSIAHSFCF